MGRPVLAILPDEFRDNQEGTLHFGYLSSVGGGLLRTSRTLDEHCAQLSEVLARSGDRAGHDAFIHAFLRPHGLDVPATPVFVDAVEAMAAEARSPAAHQSDAGATAIGRWILDRLDRLSRSRRFAPWFFDEEERRARAWRGAKARSGRRSAAPISTRTREPRPKGPCEPNGRRREDRLHRAPLLLPAAVRVGDRGAGRARSPDRPRRRSRGDRWAAARWSSGSPRAIPNVTTCDAPGRYAGAWAELARQLRLGLDYLRFLEPGYDETPHLRRARPRAGAAPGRAAGRLAAGRAGRRAPRARGHARRRSSAACRSPATMTRVPRPSGAGRRADHAARRHRLAAARSLRRGASARHPHGAAGRQLGPPVQQVAAARAARRASWCGTTMQQQRGRRPARRARRPRRRHRRAVLRPVVRPPAVADAARHFCARVGLRADRPFVLYVCSSLFRGTVSEPEFVESWIRALRDRAPTRG